MLRFIVSRETYDGEERSHSSLETLDCEVPELESVLLRGGYGSGPNGSGFDQTHLIGVEVRDSQ